MNSSRKEILTFVASKYNLQMKLVASLIFPKPLEVLTFMH